MNLTAVELADVLLVEDDPGIFADVSWRRCAAVCLRQAARWLTSFRAHVSGVLQV